MHSMSSEHAHLAKTWFAGLLRDGCSPSSKQRVVLPDRGRGTAGVTLSNGSSSVAEELADQLRWSDHATRLSRRSQDVADSCLGAVPRLQAAAPLEEMLEVRLQCGKFALAGVYVGELAVEQGRHV